ncbi:MAG: acyltransferase [Bacteroidales bacterium]|nr:acyltransferase [Bacteroidales bacterium]
MARENVYLASKPRYEILDGLRGVAALMVVLFHIFETYSKGPAYQIINHGYLAVDFFFVLSGFVVGYAYDDRWDKMTTWGFFKRRLTRLHPMVIVGTLVGAALFFFAGNAFPQTQQVELWKFLLCLVMGLLILPCPNSLDIRGWGELNSFNGPVWTLTLEYIGNILYAFVLRRLPKMALAVLAVICAFFTLDVTLGWNVFGLFEAPHYTVIGGWSLTPDQIYIGFTRLLYPFLCGLLISRILPARRTADNPSGSPIHLKGGFWWCGLAIVVLLAMPNIGGKMGVADGLFQAACILVLFPLIVLAGAGSKTTDRRSTAVCKWLGDISYPIYITHYPLIYMQMDWVAQHPDAPLWQHIAVGTSVVLMAILLAWGLLKAYDLPVRGWLTEHWLKRVKK